MSFNFIIIIILLVIGKMRDRQLKENYMKTKKERIIIIFNPPFGVGLH